MSADGLRHQPNFVFITVDQECRWLDLPADFPFADALPNRARLLRESTNFTQMTCASNPCGPSRAAIYSGRHFQETGCHANFLDMPETIPTIGTLLKEAGYYTAYKGKWHLTTRLNQVNDQGEAHYNDVLSQFRMASGLGSKLTLPPFGTVTDFPRSLEPYGFSDWGVGGDKAGGAEPGEGYHHDPEYAEEAVQWLRGKGVALAEEGRPFFIAVNFINPHDIMAFVASEKQRSTVSSKSPFASAPQFEYPPSPLYRKRWGVGLPRALHDHKEGRSTAVGSLALPSGHELHMMATNVIFGQLTTEDEWEAYVDYYLNCLIDVDQHIGSILDTLDEICLSANTVVIFTSDHGELRGVHGLRQKGSALYKENIGVPFVVRHPDVPTGGVSRTCGCVVSHVDLAPTLLSLAGASEVAFAAKLPGHDLSPLLLAPDLPGPRAEIGALFQVGQNFGPFQADAPALRPRIQAIVSDGFIFGRFFAWRDARPATLSDLVASSDLVLFDKAADPGEMYNLAGTTELVQRNATLITDLNAKLNSLLDQEAAEQHGVALPWLSRKEPPLGWFVSKFHTLKVRSMLKLIKTLANRNASIAPRARL